MTRTSSRITFVVTILAMTVPALAQLPLPAPPVPPQPAAAVKAPLADRLPSETLAYIGWAGYDDNAAALKATNLGQMLTSGEIENFLSKTVAELERAGLEMAGDGQEAKIYQAVRKLVQRMWHRPWAVTLMQADPPAGGEANAVRIELALVIDGGEEAAGVLADLNSLMELVVPPNVRENGKRVQIGTEMFQQISFTPEIPPLSWGRSGSNVLLLLGAEAPDRMSKVLNKTAVPLALNPQFAAATAKVGAGVLNTFFDLDALVNKVAPNWVGIAGPDAASILKIVTDSLGLGAMGVSAGSLSADGSDFVSRGFLSTPRGKPGLLSLLDQKPLSRQLLQIAPADSTFVFAGNLSLSKAHDEFEKQLKKYPEPWGQYTEGLAQVEEMLGFKIRGDLLDALGDGFVVYNSPQAGGFLITGLTIVMEVKDSERLRQSLAKLETLAANAAGGPPPQAGDEPNEGEAPGPPVSFGEMVADGQKIRYLKTAGIPNPVAPAYCVTARHFIITLFPQMTRAALSRLSAGGKGSILENPDFAKLCAKLPADAAFVGYGNDQQVMSALYPILPPAWQLICSMARQEGFKLDPSWLPTRDAMLANLTGTVGVTLNRPDGFYSESRGTMPGSAVGLLANAVATLGQLAYQSSVPRGEVMMEMERPAPQPVPVEEDF